MTVGELAAVLARLPQELSIVYPDSQHGDQRVMKAEEDTCHCGTSARIVRIS